MCEDFCEGMKTPNWPFHRDPFIISGERCSVTHDGETYHLFIIPVKKDGEDWLEFYLRTDKCTFISFMLGVMAKDVVSVDAFIYTQMPEWVEWYDEDLEKLESE